MESGTSATTPAVAATATVPTVSTAPAKAAAATTKAVEATVADAPVFVPPPVTLDEAEAAMVYELFERLSPYVMYGARHVFDEIREKLGHEAA